MDYRAMEQNALFELLSNYTVNYTRLLTENGNTVQLEKLQKEIIAIQREIQYRKKLAKYKDASTDFIYSENGDIV